jgi:hypothetical protein
LRLRSQPANPHPGTPTIEDLQARYMFALDFGIGEIKGREAIHALIKKMRADWEAGLPRTRRVSVLSLDATAFPTS